MKKAKLKIGDQIVASAVWMDECAIAMDSPAMHAIIKPSSYKTSGTFIMTSTPKAPIMDWIQNLAWENETVPQTKIGRLLYG